MIVDHILAQTAPALKNLATAVQFFVILLFSLSFHEAAHAWMANKFGDDTARLMGRLTLNPIAHIDPIGTLLIPGVMLARTLFFPSAYFLPMIIGWAKPVPVNPLRFRQFHKGEIMVSLAGPLSNFILVVFGAILCKVYLMVDPPAEVAGNILVDALGQKPLFAFFFSFLSLNSVLFVFNLIPITPLDGSHVLKRYLSTRAAEAYDSVMAPYGFIILLIFVNTRVFGFLYMAALRPIIWLITYGVNT